MGRLKAAGQVVLDLYCGIGRLRACHRGCMRNEPCVEHIGYLSLPILVHSEGSYLHSCEINPDSVEALTRSLRANGLENRFFPDRHCCFLAADVLAGVLSTMATTRSMHQKE